MREIEVRYKDLQVILFLTQDKVRNLESRHQETERKLREEYNRAEEASSKMKSLNSTVERMKKEGVLSQAFVTEFMNVKRQCQEKDRELKNLEHRFQACEKIMRALRGEIEKQAKFGELNHNKWVQMGSTLNGFSDFMRKSVNMHNELAKISEDNVLLESNVRLANFQLEASNSRLSVSQVSNNFENSMVESGFKGFNDSSSSSKNFHRKSETVTVTTTGRTSVNRTALEPITQFPF